MDQPSALDNVAWPFPFPHQDWEDTPPSVQAYLRTMQDDLTQLRARVETLAARLHQNSTTSHRPPSSDSPYKKPRQRSASATPRKAGGQPGHAGHRQALLPPTAVHALQPERCACGNTVFAVTTPYYTHQVIELPPMEMDVRHLVLHQGWCTVCGTLNQAQVPPEHATGYGPRFTALIGEIAGTHGTSRRIIQHFCASVLQVPLSLGAMQKLIDRVAQAMAPHYGAMATQARQAPVNYIDDWAGILVSDGYGVYQSWVAGRQTCLAHLIRTARGLAERQHPDLAACGAWALAELQRLCHMATAPPTGGEWRAWYARLCHLINQYHDRQDEAGKFARRLLREMDSLWVFLAQHGVDPTNNRAERALRFGVLWRKRSQGTASVKGNR